MFFQIIFACFLCRNNNSASALADIHAISGKANTNCGSRISEQVLSLFWALEGFGEGSNFYGDTLICDFVSVFLL